MPKLLPRHYAKILYSLTKEAKDVNAATQEFLRFVTEKHALKKLPSIMKEFTEYAAKQEGVTIATVTTARSLPIATIQTAVEKILGSKAEITVQTDENLLGGLHIRTSTHEYDASLRGQLNQLEKTLAK